jgi:hypothetical protein
MYFIDPDGKTLEPADKRSAVILQDVLLSTFNSNKALASLFVLQENGVYAKIDTKLLCEALKDESEDTRALANGYAKIVNDDRKYYVAFVKLGGKIIESEGSKINKKDTPRAIDGVTSVSNNPAELIGVVGGGVTIPEINSNITTCIIFDERPNEYVKVVVSEKSGGMSRVTPSLEETTAHELIGEGIIAQLKGNPQIQAGTEAVQVSNIQRRRENKGDAPRNGVGHDLNKPEDKNKLNEIPSQIKD